MDWDAAASWLKECESIYMEIGVPGRTALVVIIMPLRDRFNKGERTIELYEEIMGVS